MKKLGGHVDWKELYPMFPLGLLGLIAGIGLLYAFSSVDKSVFKQVIGALILGVLCTRWFLKVKPTDSFKRGWGMFAASISGVLTGFSHWGAGVPTVDNPYILFSESGSGLAPALLRGAFPQTAGAAYPLVIIVLGILLLLLQAVDYRICFTFILSYAATFFLINLVSPETALGAADLLIGNTLLTAFFILPDHRTISRTVRGRWISGIVAGIAGAVIRRFSAFPDGILFAVILAGIFGGIIDYGILQRRFRKARA